MNRVGSAGGTQDFTWHRAVATRARKLLLVITALIGVLAAVAVIAFTPPASRTFALVAFPVQTLMSVLVPFSGVLLASDLHRARREAKVAPMLLAAAMVAAAFALFGVLVCTIAIAVAPSEVVQGRWQYVGAIVVGSLVVQVVAQFVGTGLGLLLRSRAVAMIGTIVLPLGTWLILGAVDALSPAQAWLTPFAAAPKLLSGQMTPLNWAQVLVIVSIWGIGLNAAGSSGPGVRRASDRRQTAFRSIRLRAQSTTTSAAGRGCQPSSRRAFSVLCRLRRPRAGVIARNE